MKCTSAVAPSLGRPTAGGCPLPDHHRGERRREDGFGLVEMLVAFTILLIVLTATATLTTSLLGQAASTKDQVTATDLADQALAQVAEEPLSTLSADVNRTVDLTTSGPVTVAGTPFAMAQYLGWYGTGAAPSLCTSGNPPEVLQATVTVTWDHGRQRIAETSVIDPPYGAAQSTDGWLSVQIESAANPSEPPADVQAVQVVITPSGQASLPAEQPDPQGCLYQPVPAGSYQVVVQGPASPLFVDGDDQPDPPPTTVTVTAGRATDVDVPFDQAAMVGFTPAETSPALASGLPVTVANPGMTSGSEVAIPYPATSSGPVPLFPYPSGDTVWYGDCPDEQPAHPSTVTLVPGQPATATVGGLVTLTLAISTPGASVSATATVHDPSCPSDTFGLGQATTSGGSATVSAQIVAESFTVTVTDLADGKTATVSLEWQGDQWLDQANDQTYPPASPIPVTVS